MLLRPYLFCSLAILTVTLTAQGQTPAPEVIKRTEFAFAADALTRGSKAAFLATMHDSAIVFVQAVPTRAKPSWTARPAPKPDDPKLRWAPALVGASASGDLGYTTGPWLLTAPDGKTLDTGQFFTIWAKQPDDSYKWLLDNGISSPLETAPAALPPPEQVLIGPRGEAEKGKKTAPARVLDDELSADIARRGVVAAYASRQHAAARLLREGQPAMTSPAEIWTRLQQEGDRRLMAAGGQVAVAGDLAYTYGRYQATEAPGDHGSYVHLWVHEAGGWQLLVEMTNPAPPESAKK